MEDNPIVPGKEFAGRYTIERELGRGGAAIVYLARDNRQERQVAIKVLHRELAAAIGAQRFLREIKHSSALQHPHLLSIHESGESDGVLYYVMPYMADGSLRTRIAKEKQLSVDEALRITRDVGEALSYAHSRGIVHRDIKPDNVLFSAAHACLADFGIARAVDSVAVDTLTSTGLVVGTPAYMSPEQASGEKTVDMRSDQYSLACLVYEMITGLPPFIGATQQAVISQRFTQPPPSMRAHRPTVPDHVERAVKRALAVVPADRFPGVADFIAALHDASAVAEPVSAHSIRRRWFGVGAAAAVVTLAVIAAKPGADWMQGAFGPQLDTASFVILPFLSEEDPALGKHVANGLHSALRGWEGLGVQGDVEVRDALADAGGEVASLPAAIRIARKLGAGRLIWGTATSEAGRTKVVAHLYDVGRSVKLVEQIDVVTGGVAPDSAFRGLADGLLAFAPVPESFDPGYDGTRSYPALQAYRRGIVALARFDLDAARVELRRAIQLDPEYAVAHFELARIESWLQQNGTPSWHASAMRAVALKEELRPRDAVRAAALFSYAQKDYPTACRYYTELVATDTLDARAWYGLGACLHADERVQPDRRSPSGFSFRSSWHSAGDAFVRAMKLEPALHTLPQARRLGQVFPTAGNQIRSGVSAETDGRGFGAIPQLVADTLAFIPYPRPNFERDVNDAARDRRREALARNRRVVRAITSSWVQAYPASSQAHAAMASILEQQGELAGATQSLAMARGLAKNDLDRLLLAESDARVSYKSGDFPRARQIADSALARFRETTESNWEPVARLAGMTGAVPRFAEALQFFWARFADAEELDQAVYRTAGQVLAGAAVGLCDGGPLAVEERLNSVVRIHVPPNRHAEVKSKVVGLILSFSTPCATGNQIGTISGRDPIERAQRAFGRGDAALARAMLDSAFLGRSHLRAGDISPTSVAREAFLRLALGDTAPAIGLIDGTLEGLRTIPASTLLHPLESATLVRMMATRAEIAARTGDAASAGKWAQAVAVLWAGSDPATRPIANRMSQLAAVRPRK